MADTAMQGSGLPQITIRPADERGHFDFGWLDTYHSFSFGDYHDPAWMGFRSLRVINDDRIGPGGGFPLHPHRDMEIITYMLSGALSHRDSLGNGAVIKPGWVQYMCAGTGVMHSEHNAQDGETRLIQIWIRPPRAGLPPSYGEAAIPAAGETGRLHLIAGPRGAPITMHQDAALYAAKLAPGQNLAHGLAAGRHGWLQVARGALTLSGAALTEGDGAALSPADGGLDSALEIRADTEAEFLLFDLA
jgi:quercetin 2,3-dioxygenase